MSALAGAAQPEDADVASSTEAYARRFAGAVGTWFLAVQAHHTRALIGPWNPGPGTSRARALDVGGGHAQNVDTLLAAGFEPTVLGSRAVCAARLSPWTATGRATFTQGDLLALPFAARSFELVLAYRLLPHVQRWPELLGELCRVTRHALLFDYPTRRSLNAFAGLGFGWKHGVEGDTRPYRVFGESEVRAVLSTHGFSVRARRAQFLLPMALHRALRAAPLSRVLEALARAAGLTHILGSPVIVRAERD